MQPTIIDGLLLAEILSQVGFGSMALDPPVFGLAQVVFVLKAVPVPLGIYRNRKKFN